MFSRGLSSLITAALMAAVLAHGDAEIIRRRVGQNVTLQTGVTGLQADDYITCSILSDDSRKSDTLVTYLNRKLKVDFIDRFKGRLHLHRDSGSLTITNLNMNDTAVYEVQIMNGKSSTHTFSLIVEADPAPSSTTPPLKITTPALNTGAKVGLAVGILLVAAVIAVGLYLAVRCGGIGRGYRGCARGRRDVCSSSVV